LIITIFSTPIEYPDKAGLGMRCRESSCVTRNELREQHVVAALEMGQAFGAQETGL
jgi:hypothetical protein